MTNSDMNPAYKGRYIRNILADGVESITIDAGTILIQETGAIKVYFQSEETVVFRKEKPSYITVEKGSVIGIGIKSTKNATFCLAKFIRIPTDKEVGWYELQSTI